MELKFRRLNRTDIMNLSMCWGSAQYRQHFTDACVHWLESMDRGDIVTCMNKVTHELIGVTGWAPVGNGEAFLRWHGVREPFRRQGISRSMMAWLMSYIAAYRIHTLYETCDTEAAYRHFVNMGFTRVTDPIKLSLIRQEAGEFKYLLKYTAPKAEQQAAEKEVSFLYSPVSGLRMTTSNTPSKYRTMFPTMVWMFDPYTGNKREPDDIKADPYGLLI